MRGLILISIAFVGFLSPAQAQHRQPRGDASQSNPDIMSDEKAAETKQLIEKGRQRQKGTDRHNSDLWGRWSYAVCIGCGWAPKNVRIVHTNPMRVLAGIPAAEDDARGRLASDMQAKADIEPLSSDEAEQQSSARREHVASAIPR